MQAQANATPRDTTPKPTSAVRKPPETQAKHATPAPQPVSEELHVPTNGFNATEVEAMLSTGAADEGEIYKPDKAASKVSPSAALGAKRKNSGVFKLESAQVLIGMTIAATMLNGKDFWLELRRQVDRYARQNGSVSKDEKKQGG